MKKIIRKIPLIALALIMVMNMFCTTAFAAGYQYDEPYGFLFTDDNTGYWHVQYYELDKKNTFVVSDGVELRKSTLYTEVTNKRLMDSVSAPSEAYPTVAYDRSGRLYVITKDGSVRRMDASTCTTYSVAKDVKGKYFVLNEDDLAIKVKTSSKTITLSDLSFKGSYSIVDGSEVTTPSKGNKIETQARGDGGVIYNAYKDGKVILKVQCKDSNVWLETYSKLLSDTCVGAKFVGFSCNYAALLLDTDGTLYCFPYGQYDRAQTISLQEKVIKYNKDSSGFIYSVETDRSTYLFDKLFNDKVSSQKITYVSNNVKTGSIAYLDTKVVGTLSLADGSLKWNGSKLNHSKSPSYFGIMSNGNPVWISGGDLYCYDGRNIVCGKSNVTRLQYAANGCAESYFIGSTKHQLTDVF